MVVLELVSLRRIARRALRRSVVLLLLHLLVVNVMLLRRGLLLLRLRRHSPALLHVSHLRRRLVWRLWEHLMVLR